jgi:hypothetical protein
MVTTCPRVAFPPANEKWLREKAALKDNKPISAGGLAVAEPWLAS